MANKCTVCAHPKTRDIEKLIVQGSPNTQIAEKYGLDHQSVRYHRLNHLPAKLVQSVREKESKHTEDLWNTINELLEVARDILEQALEDDQKTTALQAVREARNTIELMARIASKRQELQQTQQEKVDDKAEEHIQEGLKALSTDELKTFIQLQAKIYSQDPDYELSPDVKLFVESAKQINLNPNSSNPYKDSEPNSRRNGAKQDKNSQKTTNPDQPEPDFEEWDDDLDLDLDSIDSHSPSSEIPSERSDPAWLKEWRKKNGQGPMPGGGRY